ncbi:hypothetical protein GCM10007981_05270 [Thermocladium modestius]|uniref:Uncharacterized protein n=1 Tax=Thermocladium modestius TaxID=62609 RepID=A0A830GUM3_9CREN|nr:hypothetical protein [Thermocladium modestius]GGP19864.1 hypothetical protein GCM10007981_05270 [Thermocladium modestius]
MITLIVGSPHFPEPRGLTWRRGPGCTGVGVNHPLNDLERAVLYRLGEAMGSPQGHVSLDVDFRDFIDNCVGDGCLQLRLAVDSGSEASIDRCSSYSLTPIEPAATVVGMALAAAFRDVEVEIYSDLYMDYLDVINALRLSRTGDLRIFTNAFHEESLYWVDEAYIPNVGIPSIHEFNGRFKAKMQFINRNEYKLMDPGKVGVEVYGGAGSGVDPDVLKMIDILVNKLGGSAPLASLVDLLSLSGVPTHAVSIAKSMGLIWLERRGVTTRVMATTLGFSIANQAR